MAWIFLTKHTNPYINAATEEYLLKHFDAHNELIIYLWQNDNTIVIGRNQNPFREINLQAVEQDNVNLFRRFSGGGTVYHDLGNLCYTFIDKIDFKKVNNYVFFAQPILNFLKSLGVHAEFKGRNDLEISNKKISGNAQYLYKNKLLHHGTLLFESNFDKLFKYLNVDQTKIIGKGIDSIKKRVTNISEYLSIDINQFINELYIWFLKTVNAKTINLDDKTWNWIKQRAKNYFETWEWNYGQLNETKFVNKKYFLEGTIEFYLKLDNGKIKDIQFLGDYLSVCDFEKIKPLFLNQKYTIRNISKILEQINLTNYFGQINKKQLLELMFDNGCKY